MIHLDESEFRQFCGRPDGERDGCDIFTESFESVFDDRWAVIHVVGSPRKASWIDLADTIDNLPDRGGAFVVFDSAAGDLRGLSRLQRAITTAADRDVTLFCRVELGAMGASFVAAMMFPLIWASPTAVLGGIQGSLSAVFEAVESVRRRLAKQDAEFGIPRDRARLLTRLAAGHVFNGEEAELLAVCLLHNSIENCVVPLAVPYTFQESDDV